MNFSIKRHRSTLGISPVEICAVVSVVGIFLAVFIPQFIRELQTRKITEAAIMLHKMHQHSASYFAHDHGMPLRRLRWCLPNEAGPSPPSPSEDPVEVNFFSEGLPGYQTWKALGFQPSAIRFRYSFLPETVGCGLRRDPNTTIVTYRAEGDLDNDGILSLFDLSASVTINGELIRQGTITTTNQVE